MDYSDSSGYTSDSSDSDEPGVNVNFKSNKVTIKKTSESSMICRRNRKKVYFSTNQRNQRIKKDKPITALSMPVPKKQIKKSVVFKENVLERLTKLYSWRQNCVTEQEFQKVEIWTENIIKDSAKRGLFHIELRFLFEQAKNKHLRNDMSEAIKIAQEVSHRSESLENGNEVNIFSLCVLVSCYSYLNEQGNAADILEKLESLVESNVDKWKLHYNYGTHYIALLKHDLPFPILKKCGKKAFLAARNAICEAIEEGEDHRKQEAIFPLIMMAKTILDVPESSFGRYRDEVTHEELLEAETIFKQIKTKISHSEMDIRLKARLAITESGLKFRKAQQTLRFLKEAKRVANIIDRAKYKSLTHKQLNEAIVYLDYAVSIRINTPYQESKHAIEFLDFVTNFALLNVPSTFENHAVYESDWTASSETNTFSYSEGWSSHQVSKIKERATSKQDAVTVTSSIADTEISENESEGKNTVINFKHDTTCWPDEKKTRKEYI